MKEKEILIYNAVIDIIQELALHKPAKRQLKTMGGEAWWNNIESREGFRLQQHKISRHLRILDQDNYRVYFSYSKSDSLREFGKYFGDSNE